MSYLMNWHRGMAQHWRPLPCSRQVDLTQTLSVKKKRRQWPLWVENQQNVCPHSGGRESGYCPAIRVSHIKKKPMMWCHLGNTPIKKKARCPSKRPRTWLRVTTQINHPDRSILSIDKGGTWIKEDYHTDDNKVCSRTFSHIVLSILNKHGKDHVKSKY